MVWAALAAAAILAVMLLGSRKQKAAQAVLISRLRTSGMYTGVAGMLKSLDSDLIQSVVLRQQDISIRLLDGHSYCYEYRAHQADPLSPQALRIMSHAVMIDMPRLQDERYYRRTVPSKRSSNPIYAYTMRHERKDYLLRAMQRSAL